MGPDGTVIRGSGTSLAPPRSEELQGGERTWNSEDLEGMHVCYDPDRPGEDFALTPPHYQCGDPDIFTSDGGW